MDNDQQRDSQEERYWQYYCPECDHPHYPKDRKNLCEEAWEAITKANEDHTEMGFD